MPHSNAVSREAIESPVSKFIKEIEDNSLGLKFTLR